MKYWECSLHQNKLANSVIHISCSVQAVITIVDA